MTGPLALRVQTKPEWLETVLANLDAVLLDHAHCEKKAAGTALSLVSAYPHLPELVKRCCGGNRTLGHLP